MMAPPTSEVSPQDNLLFLLGGMNSKIDGIASEQVIARTEASSFRTELRSEMAEVRNQVNELTSEVGVLKSKQVVRLRWPSIVGGIASIAAATTGGILLIQWIAQNNL